MRTKLPMKLSENQPQSRYTGGGGEGGEGGGGEKQREEEVEENEEEEGKEKVAKEVSRKLHHQAMNH